MMRLDKNLAHSFFVMADARKDVAGIKGGADGRRTWYVLHVKPRTEKKTVDFLRSYGYFHHLPVYMKITKVQRRKVRRELPLFPDERIRMLQTNLIVHTIEVLNPREMIHQLRQISRASRAKPEMRPVHSFKAGDLVRVKYGPLRGTEGYVKREGAHATLCLNVEILGAAVEISISPEDIEKA